MLIITSSNQVSIKNYDIVTNIVHISIACVSDSTVLRSRTFQPKDAMLVFLIITNMII